MVEVSLNAGGGKRSSQVTLARFNPHEFTIAPKSETRESEVNAA
jgi:hypothetical protein